MSKKTYTFYLTKTEEGQLHVEAESFAVAKSIIEDEIDGSMDFTSNSTRWTYDYDGHEIEVDFNEWEYEDEWEE